MECNECGKEVRDRKQLFAIPHCQECEVRVKREFDDAKKECIEEMRREDKRCDKVLDYIHKIVSEEYFNTIIQELKEFSHTWNFQIVEEPQGDKSDLEDTPYIIWVNQTINGGYLGDTYEGTCYMELPNGKYFAWDYSC